MEQVLALRPFVPAQNFDLSQRFYQALGFTRTHCDDEVNLLRMESFIFDPSGVLWHVAEAPF